MRFFFSIESRRQLAQDLPALFLDAFPPDGWEAILKDSAPRVALSSLLDAPDAGYPQPQGDYQALNEKSLWSKP